jgi:hypothetical protein
MSRKQRLIDWWDRKVYWFAYRSLNRMCSRDPGMALLFKLHLEGWLEKRPPSESLRSATQAFYDSLKEAQP